MMIIKNSKIKIFLGGTCPSNEGDFDYRTILIPYLNIANINYFNPVVKDWTPDCIENEQKEKDVCNVHLYVICPNMKGVYSIAEAFSTSILYPDKKGILCFLREIDNKEFDDQQLKSNKATLDLFKSCGKNNLVFDLQTIKDFDKLGQCLNSLDKNYL